MKSQKLTFTWRTCKITLLILLMNATMKTHAQVGFNNPNPHASAIVDITSSDKGLLIPRITSAVRTAIASGGLANSLLVFDTDLEQFMYWNSTAGAWYYLNAMTRSAASGTPPARLTSGLVVDGNVAIGKTSASTALDVNGTVTATTLAGVGVVPVGGIIMWSGGTVPAGWALCDGTNSTPNLTNKFIYGSSIAAIGGTGGSANATLSVANMPAHDHGGVTSSDSHTHTYFATNNQNVQTSDGGTNFHDVNVGGTSASTGGTSHSHTITTQGSGTAFSIIPPYYQLAYIKRIY
jgi:microcystin-dependent protein